ncbi:MAG: ribonuclease HIII [Candidatus Tenebribacter davisii]|jgi:ribonuclease HIII|nr:ribonuclease HIII [Candidatus Tenebribacter davisii]
MKQNLLKFISELIVKGSKFGLILSDEKEINYGVQLKFEKDGINIPINIYSSKKKGISTVIGGSPTNSLRTIFQQILEQKPDLVKRDHEWKIWAGTDESGKGDFFGALVVCGFIVKENDVLDIQNLGVKDCKLLRDTEVIGIAEKLYANYKNNIETLILQPAKYNELYAKFRQGNKKLNEMLAWMHARVIINLNKKNQFEGAVVDKFTSDQVLTNSLVEMKSIKLIHKIKAEDDIAVAAASIIARYHFLNSIDKLSLRYKLKFPKGASEKVIKVGKEFVEKYSKNRLNEVAKTHFKTYEKM